MSNAERTNVAIEDARARIKSDSSLQVPSMSEMEIFRQRGRYFAMPGGEIGLHFKRIEGLNKPIVFVFPEVIVCLGMRTR
jgi:hypothetical protein